MEEEQTEKKKEEIKPRRGWVKYVLILACALLIILPAISLYGNVADRRAEIAAVRNLHSFGSAELAYSQRNLRQHWGSLAALQESGDIPANETLRNAIPYYRLTWITMDYTESDRVAETALKGPDNWGSPFTIIAYPYHPAKLHTFAVTEDQVIREFSPEKGDKPNAVHSWSPTQLQQ